MNLHINLMNDFCCTVQGAAEDQLLLSDESSDIGCPRLMSILPSNKSACLKKASSSSIASYSALNAGSSIHFATISSWVIVGGVRLPVMFGFHYAAMLPTVNSTWYAEYGNTIFAPSWSMTPAVSSAVTSRCTARKSRPTRLASSRMDIASAPVMALMMASRFGASIVLASDSISGNVRENGASTGCPDIAATNAALVSSLEASRDITRTVSVVILPPYSVDVGVKLFEQVSEIGERHRVFTVADMFMVTLASLVVIAHNASIVNNVGHTVLIAVVTGANRGINRPDGNADKGVFSRKDIAFFDEQLRWHYVFSLCDDNNSITLLMMSNMTSLDSLHSERYTARATPQWVVGRGNPESFTEHNRSSGFFMCLAWPHLRIMVGRAGQLSGWPGSVVTGISTPVRLTTSKRGNFGGELSKFTTEAAIMATVPTLSQPEVLLVNGRIVTSSLSLAAYFVKRHDDILKRIKNLECSPEFTARNFAASEYSDPTGRKLPCYEITRDGFAFLAMGFTGKRAAIFKENYIEAFNRMEALSVGTALSCRSRIVLTLENGVVVDSRPIAPGEHTCSLETFFEMAERQGYLIIHADDLKSLSLGHKKRGDA